MKGEFRCGAAKRCITPPETMLSALRGLKHYSFGGVLDDIFVRTALIETDDERILFVDYDLNTAPCDEAFMEALSQQTGTQVDAVFLFATHTHSVPVHSLSLERIEELSDETIQASKNYTEFLQKQTLLAAKDALKKLEPAKIGFAFGESTINVVRLQDYLYTDEDGKDFTVCNLGVDPTRMPDRRLGILRIENEIGEPILLLVNYPVHCVASIWNDFDGNGGMGVSGDIAGGVERLLEEEYPGCIAMWSSSAAGDLNPLLLNEMISPDPFTGRTRELKAVGCESAKNCLRLMVERHYADIRRLLRKVHCDETEIEIDAVSEWSVTPGVDCIRRKDAPPIFLEGEDVPEHRVYLQMAKVGDLHIVGIGAELYSSLGNAMLSEIPGAAMLITHNGSTLGKCHYILDDETLARCDDSRGFAMVPGYDEYRCKEGIMREDLCSHTRSMRKHLAD